MQYSACYVLPVEDSMDGIFESVKRAALIHKSGGGTGFAFSRLRPMGDIVGSTGGVAGPGQFHGGVQWGHRVGEAGRHPPGRQHGYPAHRPPRRAALRRLQAPAARRPAGGLRGNRPRIDACGREALKMRLLETQISNFNISLAVTDRFMEALAARRRVRSDPSTQSGDIVKRLRARDVFDRMVRRPGRRVTRASSSSTGSTRAPRIRCPRWARRGDKSVR